MEKKYSLGNMRPANPEQLTVTQIRFNQAQLTPAATQRKLPLNFDDRKQLKMKSFHISGGERLGLSNPESRRREYLLLQASGSRPQAEVPPVSLQCPDKKEEVKPTSNC
jgi:hypothetical protein